MKLRRFFSVLNRPLPGWLTLALFMLTAASASIYLYVGSVSVPAGGSFTTNSASTVTFGAPLAIANGGTGAATQNFVDLSSTQTIGGAKTFSSAPASANGFTAGSSTYGPTGASVNGVMRDIGETSSANFGAGGVNAGIAAVLAGGTNGVGIGWNATAGNGEADIVTGYNGPTTANFIHWNGTAYVSSAQIGSDGTYGTGSSTYGPTSAVVNGPFTGTQFNGSGAGLTAGSVPNAALVTAPVTSVGASAPLSSSGGVNPIISCSTCGGTPVMGSGGTTVTGAHIVTGAWSCVTATLAAGDNACAATATFTGAAIYSTASSYSCSESIYSYTNTSATGLLIASGSVSLGVNYPFTTSGSSVTFGRVIQATIAGGTIGMNGSYYCVGV